MAFVDIPQLSRQRSNSSVDQLFDAIQNLDDAQICALLEEFNSTVASNVPVSHGIDLFERPQSKISSVRTTSVRQSNIQPQRVLTQSKSKAAPSPSADSRSTECYPPQPKALRKQHSTSIFPQSTPSTPSSLSPGSIFGSSTVSSEAEDASMDSLELLVFGRSPRETCEMNDIFEVLNHN